METLSYFREKAKPCRRLAATIADQDDPAVTAMTALLALAEEFESKSAPRPDEHGGGSDVENSAS